jgi:hypothetical protein
MNEEKDNTNPIRYSIKRIKDISFSINERAFKNDPSKAIKVELNNLFGVNIETNIIDFTLNIFLHYVDDEEVIAEIQVQNIFEVDNLKQFSNQTGLYLPNNLLIAIVGMSIAHGRALLAKNLAGTVYQEVILPITDPIKVAQHFFPNMFPKATEKKENKPVEPTRKVMLRVKKDK